MKLSLAFALKRHDIVEHVWRLREPPQRRTERLEKDVYFFIEIKDKEDGMFPFSNIIVHYGAFVSIDVRNSWPYNAMICESRFELFREESIQAAFFEEVQDDDKFQEVVKKTLKRYLPGF